MSEHISVDGFPITEGAKFWNNDLRVVKVIEVASSDNPYGNTGSTQTWHRCTEGPARGGYGIFDTLSGALAPYGRLVRHFDGLDAEAYEPGTTVASLR